MFCHLCGLWTPSKYQKGNFCEVCEKKDWRAPKCISPRCENFGNSLNSGWCNSCVVRRKHNSFTDRYVEVEFDFTIEMGYKEIRKRHVECLNNFTFLNDLSMLIINYLDSMQDFQRILHYGCQTRLSTLDEIGWDLFQENITLCPMEIEWTRQERMGGHWFLYVTVNAMKESVPIDAQAHFCF